MHRGGEAEASSGGLPCAFQDAITMEMKAAIGSCKCIHWLCNNEVYHNIFTLWLIALAAHISKLSNVHNATYTS